MTMKIAEDFPRFETVEAFEIWADQQPEKYELIDGAVVMMAGGTINHAHICRNLLMGATNRLRGGTCVPFGSDLSVTINPLNSFLPDMHVRCGPSNDPVVICEVLSPSTMSFDLSAKAVLYGKLPSVRHLVFVWQDRVHVKHLHRTGQDEFLVTDITDADRMLSLTAIGIEIPVAEIYERVVFKLGE